MQNIHAMCFCFGKKNDEKTIKKQKQ